MKNKRKKESVTPKVNFTGFALTTILLLLGIVLSFVYFTPRGERYVGTSFPSQQVLPTEPPGSGGGGGGGSPSIMKTPLSPLCYRNGGYCVDRPTDCSALSSGSMRYHPVPSNPTGSGRYDQCLVTQDCCVPCGNNYKDTNEDCDGTDLDGSTCSSQGFGCSRNFCTFTF